MTLLRANDGRATLTLPTGECRVCPKSFVKMNSMQIVCSAKCGLQYARSARVTATNTIKAEKRETKKKLDALKPRSHWLKEAQRDFNAWIRARDAQAPCISCGRDHQGQWHAGHYLSVGARPELRFDEDNVHKQCQPCNTHLHGNVALYRMGLIERRGSGVVDRLETTHEAKKYTVDELKALAADYRARTRMLLKEQE